MKEGQLTHTETSPTAATVGNRLYGPSGVMSYRVRLQSGAGGIVDVDVDAATGDEAANLALEQFIGGKVMQVSPAPQKPQRETLKVSA
jgi:hypothetical protein